MGIQPYCYGCIEVRCVAEAVDNFAAGKFAVLLHLCDFCYVITVSGDFTMLQKSWRISRYFTFLPLLLKMSPCCYNWLELVERFNIQFMCYENVAEKDREMSWTKCAKKSSRLMWNIVKSEAVKLCNYICDFMRSAFVMFYPVLWLG